MMRTVSLFVVVLSALAGAWMILRGDFYLPNRFDLALATHFSGTAAQLLGAALLSLSAAGASFMQHMASGQRTTHSRRWQVRHFVLISLTVALLPGLPATVERRCTLTMRVGRATEASSLRDGNREPDACRRYLRAVCSSDQHA